MQIKASVSFNQYLRLLFGLAYRKPIMILLLSIALLLVMWIVTFNFHLLLLPAPVYYQYLTLSLILFIQPLVIYITIRRNYFSSNHLKEKLAIEFTNDEIKIRGDSFYTTLIWMKTYKVVELEKWYLIYQNTLSAILIPKKSFEVGQEQEFKAMLKSIKGIKLHLANKTITLKEKDIV